MARIKVVMGVGDGGWEMGDGSWEIEEIEEIEKMEEMGELEEMGSNNCLLVTLGETKNR
ncbi:hypothetical protein PN462_22230 [Spirulina sp. CS-785/01]|uniref:hypothetical protein n=1 Tax=Spirulina sp. CS-785/01 TaxID=3021716 RepID=UPI00232A9732|nr:hypothetical protein [Spirulina sp. CS-785/01]MDB9315846.1 hypothetical protein [Spirulina sp. CS-785/01]